MGIYIMKSKARKISTLVIAILMVMLFFVDISGYLYQKWVIRNINIYDLVEEPIIESMIDNDQDVIIYKYDKKCELVYIGNVSDDSAKFLLKKSEYLFNYGNLEYYIIF